MRRLLRGQSNFCLISEAKSSWDIFQRIYDCFPRTSHTTACAHSKGVSDLESCVDSFFLPRISFESLNFHARSLWMQYRGVSVYLKLGGQVVMQRASTTRRNLLFCQKMSRQLPTLTTRHLRPCPTIQQQQAARFFVECQLQSRLEAVTIDLGAWLFFIRP